MARMSSAACRFSKFLRVSPSIGSSSSFVLCGQGRSLKLYSSGTADGDADAEGFGEKSNGSEEIDDDDFLSAKPELQLHSVDPKRGWGFRGVHKAIICGTVGQVPVQKILRNGRTVTIFTVGTGGMYDQRIVLRKGMQRPVQWHRIAVHNDMLGAYAVQQLLKNSSVYVEGDIETRVYNDSINSDIKSIPEICVRNDGRLRLIKSGEKISSLSLEELKEGLLQ